MKRGWVTISVKREGYFASEMIWRGRVEGTRPGTEFRAKSTKSERYCVERIVQKLKWRMRYTKAPRVRMDRAFFGFWFVSWEGTD